METLRDNFPYMNRRAVERLEVIVVGAGIAGLTVGLALSQTGHSVTILEAARDLVEVGAGIQLAPNATRILHRLGLLDRVMLHANVPSRVSIRRWDSDKELGSSPMMPLLGLKYGAPMGVIHRGDLQCVLLEAVREHGCSVLRSHVVVATHADFLPHVQVLDRQTGLTRWLKGDLVVAADGIQSKIRELMGEAGEYQTSLLPTGDAAFRLLVPRASILNNRRLMNMVDQDIVVRYMGPGGHVVGYPLRDGQLYNLVLLHPAKIANGKTYDDAHASHDEHAEMIKFYETWSPLIRDWLAHADTEVRKWPLGTLKPLPTWIRGSVVLAGDACHPMLPYVAQGASNGIEDAAVLAAAFTCTANIPLALGVYESVRKPRADRIVASAASTGHALHLPDGPEQRERDSRIQKAAEGMADGDDWRDSQWQDFVWGTDVMRMTIDKWEELAAHWAADKTGTGE